MWTYSDPNWWIDKIANACAPDGKAEYQPPQADSYFPTIKDGLAGTLRYLGGSPNQLSPEDARRSLFWAKALKKWRLTVPNVGCAEDRRNRALAGFVDRNLKLAADPDGGVPVYYDMMRRVLEKWLPPLQADIKEHIYGRFGPGAVAERLPHPARFERLTRWLDHGMAPEEPSGYVEDADWHCTPVSRLCAVPKDWDKDRLITVEPVLQSYTQQYVRRVLQESVHLSPLRGSAMDLGYTDGQAIQRRLALKASRTGSCATIDLSDASDSISWAAVQAVFPAWVVDLLYSSRSPQFELPNHAGCAEILHIYAGMGNATTFTVETLFFSAFVVAWCRAHGHRPWVSTFGDDIIVSSDVAKGILDDGYKLYFQVNPSKSFIGSDGIRESCGIYALRGVDITVPKVDGYLPGWEGRLGLCDLHRRLVSSTDLWQHRLAHEIAATGLVENWPFLVDGYPSIEDWSAEFSALPRSRWNPEYQHSEVRVRCREARMRRFPCQDAFVDELLDPNVLGLSSDELYKYYSRSLEVPARVWLDGVLSGACTTDPARVQTRDKKGRHSAFSTVSFPTGSYKTRSCWRTVVRSHV